MTQRGAPIPKANFLSLWLELILLLAAGSGFCREGQTLGVDAESQRKVTRLLQKIIGEYWDGESKNPALTNGTEISTNVEAAFREASRLMPERLDLRIGIASSLISQALQTNGVELELKVQEALKIYQEVWALDTNSFEAPIWFAACSRAIGEINQADWALSQLIAIHPQPTTEYLQKFTRLDRILQIVPKETPCNTMPQDNCHAIVVLGAGLETNGTIKAKLNSRLAQGLKLARLYPKAPIILTGGNQKNGVTEAYMMSRWYAQRGISNKRLIIEDKAKDTVQNALFSSAILQRLGVTHVTVVTSSNHVRRGLADLQEACFQRGLKLEFDDLGAKTKGEKDPDPEQERLGIYRDLMRTSGLWAFPGLRR
jgi:hypothetical protein